MNTIRSNNSEKTFPLSLLESSFQRYKDWKYSRPTLETLFGENLY
jgi:hypothetical protein